MNFLASSLKNSYISEKNLQSPQNKQKLCSEEIVLSLVTFLYIYSIKA